MHASCASTRPPAPRALARRSMQRLAGPCLQLLRGEAAPGRPLHGLGGLCVCVRVRTSGVRLPRPRSSRRAGGTCPALNERSALAPLRSSGTQAGHRQVRPWATEPVTGLSSCYELSEKPNGCGQLGCGCQVGATRAGSCARRWQTMLDTILWGPRSTGIYDPNA